VREYLQEVFREGGKFPDVLEENEERRRECLLGVEDTKCHLMMDVGDYTDFFAGVHHARNAGTIFRVSEGVVYFLFSESRDWDYLPFEISGFRTLKRQRCTNTPPGPRKCPPT
jgi:hypothetical protein